MAKWKNFPSEDTTTINLVDLDTDESITVSLDSEGQASLFEQEVDMVNSPPHYIIRPGLEWIDVREALAQKLLREGIVLPYEDFSDWDRGLEYLVRAPFKNGLEDLGKVLFYLNRLVKRMKQRGEYKHEKED
jgi:hypothetical protein